jgi:carbamate kinase
MACRTVAWSPVRSLSAKYSLCDGSLPMETIVVCTGGEGIPVVAEPDGCYHGAEAVIDNDRSASLQSPMRSTLPGSNC